MKKIFCLIILCSMIFSLSSFADDNITVEIDNNIISFDVNPVIKNDRVMVPIRKIFEELGASVSWEESSRTVAAARGSTAIKLNIGSNIMYKNGEMILLLPSPFIVNGRTLVPVRVISESFDYDVSWNENLRKVIIKTDSQVGESPDSDTGSSDSAFAEEVLRLVNTERQKNGLSSLSLDTSLSNVALTHSKDMHDNGYFSHTNLSGESPFDRLKKAGISYQSAGENIAAGQTTPSAVVNSWMNSDGHRKNILSSSYNKMGLGYYKGTKGYKSYWTQVFTN